MLWESTAIKELQALQQEFSQSRLQVQKKDTPSESQELVSKHRNLMAKIRVIFAVQEQFFKDHPEAGDADEKKTFLERCSEQRRKIEQIEANINPLPVVASNEASAADSDIQMEDVDEQMLLSTGEGAKIVKFLAHYEGASELVLEVDRAIEQVQKKLLTEMELKAEKEELESATKMKTVTGDAESKR